MAKRCKLLLAAAAIIVIGAAVLWILAKREPFVVVCNCVRLGMTKAEVESLVQPVSEPQYGAPTPQVAYSSNLYLATAVRKGDTPFHVICGKIGDLPKLLEETGLDVHYWAQRDHVLIVGFNDDGRVCFALMNFTPSFQD